MSEYRYYWSAKADAWLHYRSGTYPDNFWPSFSDSSKACKNLFIFDEYENLLWVAIDLEPLCKRLASIIKKKFRVPNLRYESDEKENGSQLLWDRMDWILRRKGHEFENVLQLVETTIIKYAKKQTKRGQHALNNANAVAKTDAA